MGAVQSQIAVANRGVIPPANYVQPTTGEETWFKILVGTFGVIGGLAGSVQLGLAVYKFLEERRRRAAKNAAPNDEEAAIDPAVRNAHPVPAMMERPGIPAESRIVDPRNIIGRNAENVGTRTGAPSVVLPQSDNESLYHSAEGSIAELGGGHHGPDVYDRDIAITAEADIADMRVSEPTQADADDLA